MNSRLGLILLSATALSSCIPMARGMTQTVESCEIECSTKGEVLGAFVYEGSSGRGCFCEQADASTIVHNSTIHRAAAISSYEIAELRKRRIRAAQAANQQMHMQAAHMHMPP